MSGNPMDNINHLLQLELYKKEKIVEYLITKQINNKLKQLDDDKSEYEKNFKAYIQLLIFSLQQELIEIIADKSKNIFTIVQDLEIILKNLQKHDQFGSIYACINPEKIKQMKNVLETFKNIDYDKIKNVCEIIDKIINVIKKNEEMIMICQQRINTSGRTCFEKLADEFEEKEIIIKKKNEIMENGLQRINLFKGEKIEKFTDEFVKDDQYDTAGSLTETNFTSPEN